MGSRWVCCAHNPSGTVVTSRNAPAPAAPPHHGAGARQTCPRREDGDAHLAVRAFADVGAAVEAISHAVSKLSNLRELIIADELGNLQLGNLSVGLSESSVSGMHSIARAYELNWYMLDFKIDTLGVSESYFEFKWRLMCAHARKTNARCVLAILEGVLPGTMPVHRFLRRDGDNAIMYRVVRFMTG